MAWYNLRLDITAYKNKIMANFEAILDGTQPFTGNVTIGGSLAINGALTGVTTGSFSGTLSMATGKHIDFPEAVLIGSLPNVNADNTAVIIGAEAGGSSTGAGSVLIGSRAGFNLTTGAANILIGSRAGETLTTGANNIMVGDNAGFSSNGGRCVMIGDGAGRHETGNGKLFIDTYGRADEATARTGAIIYGVMNTVPASQTLALNAVTNVSVTTESTSTTTGAFKCSGGGAFAKNLNVGGDIATVPWTAFTPTVTSDGTVPVFSTNTGYYKKIGKTVFYQIYLADDGGAEGAGANQIDITTPTAIAATNITCGNGLIYNNASTTQVTVAYSTANTIKLYKPNQATVTCDDQNNATRNIRIAGWYEST